MEDILSNFSTGGRLGIHTVNLIRSDFVNTDAGTVLRDCYDYAENYLSSLLLMGVEESVYEFEFRDSEFVYFKLRVEDNKYINSLFLYPSFLACYDEVCVGIKVNVVWVYNDEVQLNYLLEQNKTINLAVINCSDCVGELVTTTLPEGILNKLYVGKVKRLSSIPLLNISKCRDRFSRNTLKETPRAVIDRISSLRLYYEVCLEGDYLVDFIEFVKKSSNIGTFELVFDVYSQEDAFSLERGEANLQELIRVAREKGAFVQIMFTKDTGHRWVTWDLAELKSNIVKLGGMVL